MHKYVRYVPPYAAEAELNQSKAARENLHDTTMDVDSILDYPLKPEPPLVIDFFPKEKATNCFADTICEFSEQLTPEELYQALLDAMKSYYLNIKKFKNLIN